MILTEDGAQNDDEENTQHGGCRDNDARRGTVARITRVRLVVVGHVCIKVFSIRWTGGYLIFTCNHYKRIRLISEKHCSWCAPFWQPRASRLSGHAHMYVVYLYRHKCEQSPLFLTHGEYWYGCRDWETTRTSSAPLRPVRTSLAIWKPRFADFHIDLLYQLDQYIFDSNRATLNGCVVCSTICLRSRPSRSDISIRSSNASAQYNWRVLKTKAKYVFLTLFFLKSQKEAINKSKNEPVVNAESSWKA